MDRLRALTWVAFGTLLVAPVASRSQEYVSITCSSTFMGLDLACLISPESSKYYPYPDEKFSAIVTKKERTEKAKQNPKIRERPDLDMRGSGPSIRFGALVPHRIDRIRYRVGSQQLDGGRDQQRFQYLGVFGQWVKPEGLRLVGQYYRHPVVQRLNERVGCRGDDGTRLDHLALWRFPCFP